VAVTESSEVARGVTETEPVLDTPVLERPAPKGGRWSRLGSVEALAAIVVLVLLGRGWLVDAFSSPRTLTLVTVFVSIMVQAMPFLVLGTILSASITAFVPTRFFERALPRHPVAAVPVAGLAGMILPACECGSVPVAGALMRRGVVPSAAFAFLLASPAINPIVLISTAVAFPGQPSMVLARFVASLLTAVGMGWLWLRLGQPQWLRPIRIPDSHTDRGWAAFWTSCRHDLVMAGGFLVIGAFCAALLNVTVPPVWLETIAANKVFAVIALALLAVLLSICSEADAFVAASLSQFSLTARLAFLVVGPMVDLKLFAMQVGSFGPRFAVRFAPTTLVLAILVATGVGWVLF
jgi:uncharacterized membrane protein YraQ (UPF0718 family)